MKNISEKLSRMSTRWVVLLSLALFIGFVIFVLPEQSARADDSANDAGSPDLSFMYSTRDLYKMAETYGEQGRDEYVRARFTFDLVWPIVYTFFLVTAISWFYKKAFPVENVWQRVNLIPILAMALDYLENVSTSIVMARYPVRTLVVEMLATVFTPIKWVFVGFSFTLLLIGIAFAAWGWLKDNQRKQP